MLEKTIEIAIETENTVIPTPVFHDSGRRRIACSAARRCGL